TCSRLLITVISKKTGSRFVWFSGWGINCKKMKVRLKKSLLLISTVVLCCSVLNATAQRKSSFGIGANIAFYSYSKTWINNDDLDIKIGSGNKVNRVFDYIYHPQLFSLTGINIILV